MRIVRDPLLVGLIPALTHPHNMQYTINVHAVVTHTLALVFGTRAVVFGSCSEFVFEALVFGK